MTDLDSPILPEAVRDTLGGPHLSIPATIDSDGKPQTSVIFVKPDGDHLLLSTIRGRRKTINMSRDPRVSLLIHGLPADRPNRAGDGPNYVAISGTVELSDDPDGAFHQRCTTSTWPARCLPPGPGARRVIARIIPRRIYVPTFPGASRGESPVPDGDP